MQSAPFITGQPMVHSHTAFPAWVFLCQPPVYQLYIYGWASGRGSQRLSYYYYLGFLAVAPELTMHPLTEFHKEWCHNCTLWMDGQGAETGLLDKIR